MKFFKIGLFVGALLAMGAGCAASEYDIAQMEAEQAAANPPPNQLGCSPAQWRVVSSDLESVRRRIDNLASDAAQACSERFQREWFRCLCDPRGFDGAPVPAGCESAGYKVCQERSLALPNCENELIQLSDDACRKQLVVLNAYAHCAQKPGWHFITIDTPRGPYPCSNSL